MAQQKIAIVGGPGKWDLMLALFERKGVVLRLEDRQGTLDPICLGESDYFKRGHMVRCDLTVYIDVLQRCDVIFEERWTIAGRVGRTGRWFYCELDLQTRKGWIIFVKLPEQVTAMITLVHQAVA